MQRMKRHVPGAVRDAIISCLQNGEMANQEILGCVRASLGDVPASSVRSYLQLNRETTFERRGRGRYRLRKL